MIDESHVTVPQIGGMYNGDRSRKDSAGRVRLPPAVGARQPAAQVRGVRAPGAPGDLRVGHARRIREDARRRRWSSRWCGPTGLIDPGADPAARVVAGGRPALGSEQARGDERARAGDDAHQAHGRGPHRLPRRARREGALPALGHRHRRARRDHPRPAQGGVRRAGGHQPAARGPRHSRGVAGGDPRRGQGRVPALRAARSSRPSGAPRATSTARRSSMPTR